jgi:hypothetical protein
MKILPKITIMTQKPLKINLMTEELVNTIILTENHLKIRDIIITKIIVMKGKRLNIKLWLGNFLSLTLWWRNS